MIIWLFFLFSVITLLILHDNAITHKSKMFIEYTLIGITVYFATFRDGMGADYLRYIYRTEYFNKGDELLNDLITNIVYSTSLSPVFYFLITAILIYPVVIHFLLKQDNGNLATLAFYLSPGLGFLQSFNAIRQFIALSFFIVAIRFIQKRNLLYYSIFVVLGSLFHASALFLAPMYYIIDKRWPKSIMILLLLVSVFAASLFAPIGNLIIGSTNYAEYIDSERSSSLMFAVLSIIIAFVVYKRDSIPTYFVSYEEAEIEEQKINIIINSAFICCFFFNLSVGSLAFSRFALYFIPFLFVALMYINNIANRKELSYLVIAFFSLFFIKYLLESNLPEKILPIDSITDSVFDTLKINYSYE